MKKTPKTEAHRITYIYYSKIEHTLSDEYCVVSWGIAKDLALIAVDEILKIDLSKPYQEENYLANWWSQVKKEIEML